MARKESKKRAVKNLRSIEVIGAPYDFSGIMKKLDLVGVPYAWESVVNNDEYLSRYYRWLVVSSDRLESLNKRLKRRSLTTNQMIQEHLHTKIVTFETECAVEYLDIIFETRLSKHLYYSCPTRGLSRLKNDVGFTSAMTLIYLNRLSSCINDYSFTIAQQYFGQLKNESKESQSCDQSVRSVIDQLSDSEKIVSVETLKNGKNPKAKKKRSWWTS